MKKKIDYGEHRDPDPEKFPSISNVASATECTGLMPTPPHTEAEAISYEQLSTMEIPRGQQKPQAKPRRRGRQ